MPKIWNQKVPQNGGSEYALAKKFENLSADERARNGGVAFETDETRRMTEKLVGKDPTTLKDTASWAFSTAPGTDDTFITGAGHGRYSGLGACFVALPFNSEWGSDDYLTSGKLGVHTSSLGLPPFLTKLRSLADKALTVIRDKKTTRRRTAFFITATRRKRERKAFNYDVITSEGFESSDLKFTPSDFYNTRSASKVYLVLEGESI